MPDRTGEPTSVQAAQTVLGAYEARQSAVRRAELLAERERWAETEPGSAVTRSRERFSPEIFEAPRTDTAIRADDVVGEMVSPDNIRLLRDSVVEQNPEIAARLDYFGQKVADADARAAGADVPARPASPDDIQIAADLYPKAATRLAELATDISRARKPERRADLIKEHNDIIAGLERREHARAIRDAEVALGLRPGPRALFDEMLRTADTYGRQPVARKTDLLRGAVSELLDDGRVSSTADLAAGRPPRLDPDPPPAEIAAAADRGASQSDEIAALEAEIAGREDMLASTQAATGTNLRPGELAAADEAIARADAEAKAYDIATACALGAP